ncbi:hypothetical protein CAEBREN_14623 [Caenorhabditis brenneri]|uniref:Receptor L-domain domain-containing protein n=1 Tax=Caenorhabditis brenneri TaxID=135651 RepID=G0PFB8_CAEBE|nr:hypothetical protein CAEBREN_14623 [Caenorhabditis brenneri]
MNIWSLLILPLCVANYFPELQKIVEQYQYDPDCVFNYTVVNSKNIKKFPKCDMVYAILVINNNTDLTVAELKKSFSKMESLVGGVRIENTSYTNISFLTPPAEGAISFTVDSYGFHVLNNAELTDASVLWDSWIWLIDDIDEPEFRIENNPKLDAKYLCDYGFLSTYTDIITQGNLRDSGCPEIVINSSTNKIPNCESVFQGIKIYNITDNTDLSHLSSIQFLRGIIDIQNTNLQNLSFLENVGDFKIDTYEDKEKIFLNLKNNPQMTRFGMTYLKEIQNGWQTGIKLANFENLHPDFCLTIEEIAFFLENYVSFVNFHAKICADNRTKIHNTVICHFESMSRLPGDCNMIIGDLIVNPGNEPHFNKIEKLRYLFGSVVIQNTSLEDLDMLNGIRYVLKLNESQPVIQVVGNKKIERLFFRDLENIVTRGERSAIIQDNNKDLFQYDDGNCKIFYGTEDWVNKRYRTMLDITGGNCGNL